MNIQGMHEAKVRLHDLDFYLTFYFETSLNDPMGLRCVIESIWFEDDTDITKFAMHFLPQLEEMASESLEEDEEVYASFDLEDACFYAEGHLEQDGGSYDTPPYCEFVCQKIVFTGGGIKHVLAKYCPRVIEDIKLNLNWNPCQTK